MVTDKKIISGCVEGDRVAQRELYEKYSPAMYAICIRYSKDRFEAEDILHDTFMKVYLNMKDFRNEGSFEGWIKRIVINTALNHKQKTKNNNYHQNFDNIRETEILDQNNEHENDEIDIEFTKDELVNAIHDLPCGYRTVFNLYVFEKFKHKEISEKLEITESTSKSQLRKARILLKKKLLNETIVKKLAI